MLGRLFFVLVLLAVILYVIKYLRTKIDETQKHAQKPEADNHSDDINQPTKKLMVRCQQCGLHIPEREAIKQGDRVFCSLEHAKQKL